MRQKTKERKKRMRKVEEGRGSETRALRPPTRGWVGLETWTAFTLCTDSITDCVPIYHSMSVRETQGRSDMEDRAEALLAHKSPLEGSTGSTSK